MSNSQTEQLPAHSPWGVWQRYPKAEPLSPEQTRTLRSLRRRRARRWLFLPWLALALPALLAALGWTLLRELQTKLQ